MHTSLLLQAHITIEVVKGAAVVKVMYSQLGDQYLIPAEIQVSHRLAMYAAAKSFQPTNCIISTGFIQQLKQNIKDFQRSSVCLEEQKLFA